jgi:ribose transport system ATP-binding protein/rhamnose transport system ATP-binding protein
VRAVAETSTDELIRLMVGREVHFSRAAEKPKLGPVLLEVDALEAKPFVREASLAVRAGEIVCLAGLVGSGRSETCEAIFGARATTGGSVRVNGRAVRFTGPWDAMKAGIGMVPEDRKDGGLFLQMDLAHNISVTVLDKVSGLGSMSEPKAVALA